MSLPTINGVRTTVNLPSGKTLRLRPFNGSEEKLLLQSKLSKDTTEMLTASIEVLTTSSDFDIRTLPITDLDTLFVKIYEISVDKSIPVKLKCSGEECDHYIETNIGLDTVKLPINTGGFNETIEAGKDEESGEIVTIVLGVPTIGDFMDSRSKEDSDMYLMYQALEGIYKGSNEVPKSSFTHEEFGSWLMSLIGTYSKAVKHLRNLPQVEFERKWPCEKCKKMNEIKIKGFENFFM